MEFICVYGPDIEVITLEKVRNYQTPLHNFFDVDIPDKYVLDRVNTDHCGEVLQI